jgi:hypothetical protein
MTNFDGIARLQKDKEQGLPHLAEVVDVQDKGVKIRVYGEDTNNIHDIYYNSLQIVNVGDIVYFVELSGTKLIVGRLQYGGA